MTIRGEPSDAPETAVVRELPAGVPLESVIERLPVNLGSIEIASADGSAWLRDVAPETSGSGADDRLAAVATIAWHIVDGGLARDGSSLPIRPVPDWRWMPIEHAAVLSLTRPAMNPPAQNPTTQNPTTQNPETSPARLSLTWHDDPVVRRCDALRTDLDTLNRWIDDAPRSWIHSMLWQCDRDTGRAIVRTASPDSGLPPIAGDHWVDFGGIWMPAGKRWFPEIQPESVRRLAGCRDGHEMWWTSPDRFETLDRDHWMRLSRAAVRVVASSHPALSGGELSGDASSPADRSPRDRSPGRRRDDR